MRAAAFALAATTILLAGCGRDEPETVENLSRRMEQQIDAQAEEYTNRAENFTAAFERSLENQQAVIFESRDDLLNAVGGNQAAPGNAR